MTGTPHEDQPACDPIDAFYDRLKVIFDRYRGSYGKLETYGDNLPKPVRLKKSTVRGWIKDRQALPDPTQLGAMLDFLRISRAIDDGDSARLRSLWEDACRRKKESRPPGVAEEAERPADPRPPAETELPSSQEESAGHAAAPPLTLEVHAHAHAYAQAEGGSRTRRTITWVAVGVAVGAVLPSLVLAYGTSYFSPAAKSTPVTPSATPSAVAAPPTAVPLSAKPTGKSPLPGRTTRHELAVPHATRSTARAPHPPKPVTTPGQWWCTTVVTARAGVYSEPRTNSAVLKYKVRGDGIRVVQASGTPAGWYIVITGTAGEYWMQSATLGPLRPYSACHSG